MTVIKVVKILIFQKSLTCHETNLTLLFLSFSLERPKNKAESSNRAKTGPRQSQTCGKYRGIIICIERNTDLNTSDLKKLYKKMSKYS